MPKPWTQHEVNILTHNYSKHGDAHTVARLRASGYERSLGSVRKKASKLGYNVGLPQGYIALTEVGVMMLGKRHLYKFLRSKAEREGVLYESPAARKVKYAVPEGWAYRVVEDYCDRMNVQHAGWLRTRDVAREVGIPRKRLYDIVRKHLSHPQAALLRSIERREGKMRHWYWNPRGVQLVKEAMRGTPQPRKRKKARTTYSAQVH